MTGSNNDRLLTDDELAAFAAEMAMPNDAYQQHQHTKHDQAIESGNSAAARDAVWRAASDRNLINEAETPELTEDQASALKSQLGWD
jgi:hypothetical protein